MHDVLLLVVLALVVVNVWITRIMRHSVGDATVAAASRS